MKTQDVLIKPTGTRMATIKRDLKCYLKNRHHKRANFAEIKVLNNYLVNCLFALKVRSFPKIIACKPFFFYHSCE